MIEKLVTSKTRIKILKLFLTHIDDRYYLRELERMLDESLSPLRRQLVKLTQLGILIVEEEANLKYYKLNKGFEGLEELKRIVLEQEVLDSAPAAPRSNSILRASGEAESREETFRSNDIYVGNGLKPFPTKQFRYDLAVLSFISVFVLMTAMFLVYTNTKNMKQVTTIISSKMVLDSAKYSSSEVEKDILPRSNNNNASSNNGEMASKRWKVFPGNVPVLSSGETGGEKNSKEL